MPVPEDKELELADIMAMSDKVGGGDLCLTELFKFLSYHGQL